MIPKTLIKGFSFTLLIGSVVATSWAGGLPETTHTSKTLIPAGGMALPSNAQPGKCYARVFEPPTYRTDSERVLVKEASERIEFIPAQYDWVEQQILVTPAYDKPELVPAQFETVTERIMVKPASTRWKKGRGLIEKVDNFTGEIMCLEEIPAEYKTVTKQVLKSPATTRTVHVPAQFKTVKVRKLSTPSQERRIPIPADYQSVTKTVKVSDGHMAWREVQCETNTPKPLQTNLENKSLFTESKSDSPPQSKENDWFLLWDQDKLFNDGEFVRYDK